MMTDDLENRMKEKLLEGLIEHMSDQMGSRLAPDHGLGVTVEAPDKGGLTDGLDQAKDVLESGKLPEGSSGSESASADPESDEDRLLELLSEDEDEEKHGR